MSMIKYDKDGNKIKQNAENKNHYFSTPDHIADIMASEFVKIYDGTSKVLDIGCVDGDTEFFTGNCWKKISDYKDGDMVLQYNINGTSELVVPQRFIKQFRDGDWYEIKSPRLNIVATYDHDFVVVNNSTKKISKIKTKELYEKYYNTNNTHLGIINSFQYNGSLVVDDDLLRLVVAINADGKIESPKIIDGSRPQRVKSTKYYLYLKKERKKNRLRELLTRMNIQYKESDAKLPGKIGYTTFSFRCENIDFNPKHFPREWYNLTKHCKEVIAEEIFYWDGSIQKIKAKSGVEYVKKTYFTNKKDDFDFIQFILSSNNTKNFNCVDHRDGKNDNYRLMLVKENTNILLHKSKKLTFEKKDFKQYCYCFTVPSGMLVLRKNNNIFVTGNCGKMELSRALIRAGVPKENIVGVDLEDTGEATKLGVEFYAVDFFSLNSGLFKYFITNPPYKNGLHKKILEKCIDNNMMGVFIAPNMPYHNIKCKVSKYISKEIWNDDFRKDFKLPSTQISIFTVLDKVCNDGEKLKDAYFGSGYAEFKSNYPKCPNPITNLPKYNGQPNSLVFQSCNVWSAPGVFTGKGAAFIHDCPTKNDKLITYDRPGRFWKSGDPKNYPCIQYRDEEHKQKILDFYRPIFETHRKFIVIHCENYIPCYEEKDEQ